MTWPLWYATPFGPVGSHAVPSEKSSRRRHGAAMRNAMRSSTGSECYTTPVICSPVTKIDSHVSMFALGQVFMDAQHQRVIDAAFAF